MVKFFFGKLYVCRLIKRGSHVLFNLPEESVNAGEFFYFFKETTTAEETFLRTNGRFEFQRRVVIFASVIAVVRVCFSSVESLTDVRRFLRDLSSPSDGSVFVSVVFFHLFIYLFFASRPPPLSTFPTSPFPFGCFGCSF